MLGLCHPLLGQYKAQPTSSSIKLQLEKLNVLGSVLYFAAHPDDENTRLIAYLASEQKLRTSYLSLTRGDGGQNLLGTEIGVELGLIRTQELLAARRIDHGEQYFSSAYDFGFSKTAAETFQFWNKQSVLAEAVYLIRQLQPDVIITRFPEDQRAGHGHHQASAILAREAFDAAADPNMFPEQLAYVKPWRAKRLVWNTASFANMQGTNKQYPLEIGAYNPLLGQSYGEVAALSRSQHKSQGFGAAANVGQATEKFEFVAGKQPKISIFDEVDFSWNRIPNSQAIQETITQILQAYKLDAPEKTIPALIHLKSLIAKIDDPYWKAVKNKEIDHLLLDCAGLKLESVTAKLRYALTAHIPTNNNFIVRAKDVQVVIQSINGQAVNQELRYNEPLQIAGTYTADETTQPYWLRKAHSLGKFQVDAADIGFPENKDRPQTTVDLRMNGMPLSLEIPIQYKYVDPVKGERYLPISISPQITAKLSETAILIQPQEKKTIAVHFELQGGTATQYRALINPSKQWKVEPAELELDFRNKNSIDTSISIQALDTQAQKETLTFTINGDSLRSYNELAYDHIPTIAWFPKASFSIQALNIHNPVKKVGYIPGAGDLIPESLTQIGIQVDLLKPEDINLQKLLSYDAVISGVRKLNIDKNNSKQQQLLKQYATQGGTVVYQYNVNNVEEIDQIGPYPFQLSRVRTTEENAAVELRLPNDPVLNYPNKITAQDFAGWVQERGLYFAEAIDSRYRTPLLMHDKNEAAHPGSLLIARIGKGKFVYTSLSFFRQLPAGVPGAYRLFVNLLAKEN